jgi:cell fate (sporulation/competence/biofilm development) regulator YmcA (YheA/YmcA/DUF963 family)
VEATAQSFSAAFQEKMHRIQAELPNWIQKTGRQAEAMPLIHKVMALIKERKWQEADKAADDVLALMKGAPNETKPGASAAVESLPAKIQKIQKELPAWIGSDAEKKDKATALMQQLKEHLEAKDFEQAEKTADELLALISNREIK